MLTLLNTRSASSASPPCSPSKVVRVMVSIAMADQKSTTSYLVPELITMVLDPNFRALTEIDSFSEPIEPRMKKISECKGSARGSKVLEGRS
jgi:hypothetical protein